MVDAYCIKAFLSPSVEFHTSKRHVFLHSLFSCAAKRAIYNGFMSSGAKILWMQLGVRSEKAEQIAKAAGIIVVQDRWELLGIS